MKINFPRCLASAVIFIWVGLSMVAGAEDWPIFRGPNADGTTPETGWQTIWPETGPDIAWEQEVGIGCAGVVVQGDRVVTMGNRDEQDIVSCFHAGEGALLWSYTYACVFEARMFEGGTAATPAIHDGRVYTVAYDGQVKCINLESGELVWSTHLIEDHGGRYPQWKYAGSPAVVGEFAVFDVGAEQGSTLALDRKTGKKVWGTGSDGAGYATPVPYNFGDTACLAVFKAEHMIGIRQADGGELWRIPWKTSYDVNASTPTIRGEKLFISSGYGGGRAGYFTLKEDGSPEQLWQNDEFKTKMNSGVVYGDYVYGITEKKARLLCVALKDGSIVWEERGFGQYGTLLIAGSHIVALTDDGELVLVKADPSAFTEVARAKVLDKRCWVNPSFAHGRIYCKNNEGHLVCVDVR